MLHYILFFVLHFTATIQLNKSVILDTDNRFFNSLPSGFALAIISHLLCSRFPMFAAKLLTHMMVGCLGTQVIQLVDIPFLQYSLLVIFLLAFSPLLYILILLIALNVNESEACAVVASLCSCERYIKSKSCVDYTH